MKTVGWWIVGITVAGFLTAHHSALASAVNSAQGAKTVNATVTNGQTALEDHSVALVKQSSRSSTGAHDSTSSVEADYVERSFGAMHAQVAGYLIHNRSQLNEKFLSETDLQEIAREIKQELGLRNAKLLSNSGKYQNYLQLSGEWPDATDVTVTLSSFHDDTEPDSTILSIRVHSQAGQLQNFGHDVSRVKQAVTNLQSTPQISACIEGFTSARMVGVQTDNLISQAFSVVHADVIEGVKSDLLSSISGYSSEAPGYILTNGRKMNLQVAVHYDAYHHRTNVLVGTPIITETY